MKDDTEEILKQIRRFPKRVLILDSEHVKTGGPWSSTPPPYEEEVPGHFVPAKTAMAIGKGEVPGYAFTPVIPTTVTPGHPARGRYVANHVLGSIKRINEFSRECGAGEIVAALVDMDLESGNKGFGLKIAKAVLEKYPKLPIFYFSENGEYREKAKELGVKVEWDSKRPSPSRLKEVLDEHTRNLSLLEKIKYLGREKLDERKFRHTREFAYGKRMIEKSMDLPEARWEYGGRIGLFKNKDCEGARLALALPKSGWSKYIYATMDSGKRIISALPEEFHSSIVGVVERMTRENLQSIRGGYVDVSEIGGQSAKPVLTLYGSSDDFGKANHEKAAEILNRNGLETMVREE